jgi:hypothetical protein
MNRFDLFCTLTVFFGILVGGTSMAAAQGQAQRVDCSTQSGPSCDCSTHPTDEGNCVEFDMSNIVDITDGSAVNDAYGIETEYNSQTNTYEVSAQTTVPATKILPVHPNDGQWTNSGLTTYVNEVFGLTPGGPNPQIEDFASVDKCDLGQSPYPNIRIYFSGSYARYDESTESFPSEKNIGFIHDLLAGPAGNIEISVEGYDGDFELNLPVYQCKKEMDNNLEAHQCSYKKTSTVVEHGPCENVHQQEPHTSTYYGTRVFPLEFYDPDDNTWWEIFNGTGTSKTLDDADFTIQNRYYGANGNEMTSLRQQETDTQTDSFSVGRFYDWFGPASGICGFSDVTAYDTANQDLGGLDRDVQVRTRDGDHPNNCPYNPL